MKNVFRTLLVLSVVLGLVSISIAQTKPRMKKGTTTKRVVPLVPVGTDLKVRINDTLSSKDSRIGDRFGNCDRSEPLRRSESQWSHQLDTEVRKNQRPDEHESRL